MFCPLSTPLLMGVACGSSGHHVTPYVREDYPEQHTDRYAIVDGMVDVRDSRVHNYPPRWNGAPSQDLLVIRRNHQTGAVSLDPLRWGLIPYWCQDLKGGREPINAKCETVHNLPTFRDAYRRRRCYFRSMASSSGKRSRGKRPSSLVAGRSTKG
jgi:SOS response associated peptidase (SRAP)